MASLLVFEVFLACARGPGVQGQWLDPGGRNFNIVSGADDLFEHRAGVFRPIPAVLKLVPSVISKPAPLPLSSQL